MKRYIRESREVLEALGFECEDDPFGRTDRAVYRHPYEPGTKLTIYSGATEAACKAIQARAHQIAGLGTTGSGLTKTVGDRKRAQRQRHTRERQQLRRTEERRRERAAKAEAEIRSLDAMENAERNRREIQSLMMPGGGH
ncbi:hypothetical protein SEA_YEEZY_43 [Gordonia phage Yeezy]|uniref:Uncharacterized protein n=1 Tax=Gordonia phage Yeezy TaxID=1821565 RepID=A0A142K9K5_9CAUD|nr:hypothetical protein SEA_YEEZY_43 [Gordonia phage Yeezy]AMS02788.1 hypothetical protein SEA_YEEZY_43 [Gordonia phage Yeezy]